VPRAVEPPTGWTPNRSNTPSRSPPHSHTAPLNLSMTTPANGPATAATVFPLPATDSTRTDPPPAFLFFPSSVLFSLSPVG